MARQKAPSSNGNNKIRDLVIRHDERIKDLENDVAQLSDKLDRFFLKIVIVNMGSMGVIAAIFIALLRSA